MMMVVTLGGAAAEQPHYNNLLPALVIRIGSIPDSTELTTHADQ